MVVRAYAALIGELLYIAINTVPQLSYFMTGLTLYMSKATPAHLTYAKVVLRYLIAIKKRQLMWCGQRVCFIQKLIQNGLINVKQCPTAAQTADIRKRHCLAYYLKTLRINFSATSTLATNDSSFSPS